MSQILLSWIGNTDLRAPGEPDAVGLGPIAQACTQREFAKLLLLTDYPEQRIVDYRKWLKKKVSCPIEILFTSLTSPTNFGEIYEFAREAADNAKRAASDGTSLVFHLSPGTPAMAAVWIILAKTRFAAELIESSAKYGVRTASVPFDIAADFIPDLLRDSDRKLTELSSARPPDAPEFRDIIYRSKIMQRIVARAQRIAPRGVSVLLEGESGTGKELFARAIHNASPRKLKPFVAVNCGAIPRELFESEFFGHEKGAFTGADRIRTGHFEAANGGTLFLDEIGEIPISEQVKLLRVLQESEVTRLGSKQAIKLDVRLIAATNRNLLEEVSAGQFRADLFYRVAVAVLKLPPLREREGDIGLLLDRLLGQVNSESEQEPAYKHKTFSVTARKLLLRHSWPGNVRELLNTLRRAAIWCDGDEIGADDVREALLPESIDQERNVLNQPLGDGCNLQKMLEMVAQHYLQRALDEADGNKTVAAKLVGLPSYQTFSNWMNRYRIRSGKARA
jgi:DNA-binding NtrC family response regulator